jgi:hypothetical protein
VVRASYLPKGKIEQAAMSVLDAFGRRFGRTVEPPIPVEEILESHFGLTLEFINLARELDRPDVLGATWIQEKRVAIDESLDPTERPHLLGRFRFTVAHELGHWELHRHDILNDAAQGSLFEAVTVPPIVCRSSSKEPQEWQADAFAGYLLMPQSLVETTWKNLCGSMTPYIAEREIADLSARWRLAEDKTPTVEIAREMSEYFQVSGQAMQIRLIGLGLIRTHAGQNELSLN